MHSLNLSHTQVRDVSALKDVFRLRLDGTEVADISALQWCSELYLKRCARITNFDVLGMQSVLDLTGLEVDNAVVSQLVGVKHVVLANCLSVTDASPLKDATYLDLQNCTNLKSVAGLNTVPTLKLQGCTGINFQFKSANAGRGLYTGGFRV